MKLCPHCVRHYPDSDISCAQDGFRLLPLETPGLPGQVETPLSVTDEELTAYLYSHEVAEDLSLSALPKVILPPVVPEKLPSAMPERVPSISTSPPVTFSYRKNLIKVGVGAGAAVVFVLLTVWGGRVKENRDEAERQSSAQETALQKQIEETKATSEKVLQELTELKQKVTSAPVVEPSAPAAPTTTYPEASEDEGPEPALNHNNPETANLNAQEEVSSFYSGWLTAWQNRDVEGYLKYYAPDALIKRVHKSPYRTGELRSVMRNKWSKERFIEITDHTLTWKIKGNTARATAFQRYESTTWWDEGTKTLLLRKRNGEWKIIEEGFERQGGGAKSSLTYEEQQNDH